MLLSRTGLDKILRRIMESGDLTESMQTDVQRLRDDYDEREGVLSRYGETYDGESDEYDFTPKAESNTPYLVEDGIVRVSPLLGGSALDGAGRGGAGLGSDYPYSTVNGAPTDGDTILNDTSVWKSKYDDLKAKYLDRFFGRDSDKAVEAQRADMFEDSQDMEDESDRITVDSLLYGAPDGEKDEGR